MARVGMTAERLTVAAAELADEVGFENVTVSALARRFGVKDASLYSHIRNAADLRVRVAVLALAELADRAADALAGRLLHSTFHGYLTLERAGGFDHRGVMSTTAD